MLDIDVVYILTNTAMPGFMKIGRTTRKNVVRRFLTLSGTSVPFLFLCEFAVEVKNGSLAEDMLHRMFTLERVDKKRESSNNQPEFFRPHEEEEFELMLERAKKYLNELGKDITPEILKEYNENPEFKAGKEATSEIEEEVLKSNSRRPGKNFLKMGIEPGSTISFNPDVEENQEVVRKATTHGEKKVLYDFGDGEGEKELSLSGLTKHLLDKPPSVGGLNGWLYWSYNGKSLSDLHSEYSIKEFEETEE